MAIAFDAFSTGSATGTGSHVVSHTCTGSNRALCVGVVCATTDNVTGATYNGVSMTQVGKIQGGTGGRWVYLYYLANPASGTHNVEVAFSGSSYIEINSASYTGVNQSGQPEASATNSSASAASLTGTVTTTTNNAWTVMSASQQAGTITAGSGTTRRCTTLVGAFLDSNAAITPAGSSSLIVNGASAANTGVVIASLAPVSSSITITTPARYKTFQRSGSTGSITITGTYAGSPTAIEASFNGGAYSTIDAAPAGGNYSGTLSTQNQGQGTLTVRWTNDTSVSATVADIGIGDVFVVAGDSISEGRATNAQSYSHATLKSTVFKQSDVWADGNDPVDTGTANGSHWPLLATQIMASQSVPVAFITCGTGSTDVAGTNNQWAKNNSAYAEMTSQVTASGVNSVKGVLFHLGPNAIVNASTLSLATYNTALDTLATNVVADLAGAPKISVGICGEVNTGTPPDRRAAEDNIRGAIIQAWGDNADIKPGPNLTGQDYSDDVHPKSDAEILLLAKRWWSALSETYYSGSGGRGPRLSSAAWNGARTALTVVFDRVLKTGLTFGTGAWIVKDNGSPMTISSIAYHGTNTSALVITTSAAATGPAGSTTLTFASADDAKGLVIPLSTDITPPTGTAYQLPAEPIYAATVAEAGGLAPWFTPSMSPFRPPMSGNLQG